MESWIFKVSIYKCAAKFATRKKFEDPLEGSRIEELQMEIW